MGRKSLKQQMERLAELNKQKSAISEEQKEIRAYLLEHLNKKDVESLKSGSYTLKRKVSSYSVYAVSDGVSVQATKAALSAALLEAEHKSCLKVSLNLPLLYQHQQNNHELSHYLDDYGVAIQPNYVLDFK